MHEAFAATVSGPRRDIPSTRLIEKAKRYGVRNPTDIDFAQGAPGGQMI